MIYDPPRTFGRNRKRQRDRDAGRCETQEDKEPQRSVMREFPLTITLTVMIVLIALIYYLFDDLGLSRR